MVKNNNSYWNRSVHTKLSYWFVVIAVSIELFLGLRNSTTSFGQLALIEASFGFIGIIFVDWMHGQRFTLSYKRIKFKRSKNLFIRAMTCFIVIAIIQFVFQIIPLITSTEMAMAIIFAAVCEEYFFRGMMMEPFFRFGRTSKDKFELFRGKKISYIELFGILFSAVAFAAFHVNYYKNERLIGMVFVGGLWIAFCYWYWKDITIVIIAHAILNAIFVIQFYQVFLP
ncbi:hypothetical protein LCGC14_0664670 [marine sediment metagenome]|uniref:CAAX prenyl protease 2/Lysostaphin resistance protein A-like domain-containing protein n=1 Tax=marine sediment metagenome TaxID=412755 RepID=A0A0F9TE08_9ZZZZ